MKEKTKAMIAAMDAAFGKTIKEIDDKRKAYSDMVEAAIKAGTEFPKSDTVIYYRTSESPYVQTHRIEGAHLMGMETLADILDEVAPKWFDVEDVRFEPHCPRYTVGGVPLPEWMGRFS